LTLIPDAESRLLTKHYKNGITTSHPSSSTQSNTPLLIGVWLLTFGLGLVWIIEFLIN
jgi:hypothetical protein